MDTLEFFFETSAQIKRLVNNDYRRALNRFIANTIDETPTDFYSSNIVYREFLNTIVTDILIIRDIIKSDFFEKNIFKIKIYEIDQAISEKNQFFPANRLKRFYAISSSIQKHFYLFSFSFLHSLITLSQLLLI